MYYFDNFNFNSLNISNQGKTYDIYPEAEFTTFKEITIPETISDEELQ